MGKFNISTAQAGELSAIQQEAQADLPVQEVQEVAEESPQGGNIDALLSAPDVDTLAAGVEAGAEAEIAQQQQIEREQIPDIKTRMTTDTTNNYNYSMERAQAQAKAANSGPSMDGGMNARARILGESLASNNKDTITIGGLSNPLNTIKGILDTTGAFDANGNIDARFGSIMSVITEDAMNKLSFNEPLPGENIIAQEEKVIKTDKARPVSKIQGNKQLGQLIHRDWQRYKNAQEGKPTDQYTDLPEEQAIILGDVAKELYAKANGPEFVKRYQAGDQVQFELTDQAVKQLANGAYYRKRIFPNQHAKPSKTPLKRGKLLGEGKTYTRPVSSKTGKIQGDAILNQAMSNLGQVANVVDPQRLKILLATVLPVLSGEVDPTQHPFGTINHVGKDKADSFRVKAEADPDFNFDIEYEGEINKLAQDVYNIIQEKDGANYLSYYVQAYNGRIAPQQIGFDPTSSKTTRFVTRNAIPSKATPGSRIDRNLRQMYAMMLVPDADAALPAERELLLKRNEGKLVRWGLALKQELGKITDEQVQAAADAIAQGIPVTDPKFPKLPIPQVSDPELIAAIDKKGEDGQAFIDGLMDFATYYDNTVNKKRPHFSYFNAYMDGKTNGLAANGMQMGSEQVAYNTGVLRSQAKRLLDNDVDIRKDLSNVLLESVTKDGFAGSEGKFNNEINSIANVLFNYNYPPAKQMLKDTTMTFGYGAELNTFKGTLNKTIDLLAQANPEFKAAVDNATMSNTKEELVDALHGKFVEGLANALDPDALQSRELMRSAAILHAITNELFTIKSPIGLDLNFGGTVAGEAEKITDYRLYEGGEKTGTIGAYKPTSVATSAAPKRRSDAEGNIQEVPGDVAYGGSVPGPVQSTDAATVAETVTGKSWNRLYHASNGNPYIHTIYDAFKVDAMGYDVVLDEVNKNWIDINRRWNYLEETRDSVKELSKKWQGRLESRKDMEILSPQDAAVAKYYLTPEMDSKGKPRLNRLMNRLPKLNSKLDGENLFPAVNRIVNGMKSVGYNVYSPPDRMNVRHLKRFTQLMAAELQLSDRLNEMIHRVNGKKKKLFEKIRNDGNKVYQYYSH